MRPAIALLLIGAAVLWSQDWHEWVARGIESTEHSQYAEAAEAFQKAMALAPGEVEPHVYLGGAWLAQYIPGAQAPENLEFGRKAEAEFREVLRIQPENETAILAIASLKYQEALGAPETDDKLQGLKEASSWYDRAIVVNPEDKEAYYSRAVIAWGTWYPAWLAARAQAGMAPNDPGPIIDPAVRQQLKERYSSTLDQGVSDLETALKLDPMYDDAMAYMNLLVRERADLDDTSEQYASNVQAGDKWVEKALETKRSKAAAAAAIQEANPDRPIPRIRVASKVQEAKLIRSVDPVYPSEPGVNVRGTVRLRVVIDMQGSVENIQLVSGHPLLAKAVMDAVRQWQYSPTLLNGQKVEVETEVEVSFARP